MWERTRVRLGDEQVEGSLNGHRGEFALMLAYFRKRVGVSQAKLAERAEINHSYISRLEKGDRVPTRDVTERLAASMDLDSKDRIRLLNSAGFIARGAPVVTREVLVDIDRLLDHPNQSTLVMKIVMDQLATVRWWLQLGSTVGEKTSPTSVSEAILYASASASSKP